MGLMAQFFRVTTSLSETLEEGVTWCTQFYKTKLGRTFTPTLLIALGTYVCVCGNEGTGRGMP